MIRQTGVLRLCRGSAVLLALSLVLVGCGGGDPADEPPREAPTPVAGGGDCGTFTIAYDPTNGYEASAFIVGSLASTELGCDVQYVKTTSHQAWRVVARGDADVYLDAYGDGGANENLTGDGGPVTVVGPNGINGGVDLLAPSFMGDRGLSTAQDLSDTDRIGWGQSTPAITTSPELLPLAQAFVDFENLDYEVLDTSVINSRSGMRFVLQQPPLDNDASEPNLYLAEAPRQLLGDGPGRQVVEIPESAAQPCELNGAATSCSLANFRYQKIVNTEFATSDSPAYKLVYDYRLNRADAATIIELVELSGLNVGAADVASWLNTHRHTWRRWLN